MGGEGDGVGEGGVGCVGEGEGGHEKGVELAGGVGQIADQDGAGRG